MKITEKIKKWWYFHFAIPVVREGEAGGFLWRFRRFWMEIESKSGNFKARWMADKDPYGMLVTGENDENIHGFALTVYLVSTLLTTDQKFTNAVQKALKDYEKRLTSKAKSEMKEDETEEEIAIEEVKQVQEYVEMSEKERKAYDKEVDRKFKKAAKEAQKHEA